MMHLLESDSLNVLERKLKFWLFFIIGAGGPLLPHGGEMIVGLMMKYYTSKKKKNVKMNGLHYW